MNKCQVAKGSSLQDKCLWDCTVSNNDVNAKLMGHAKKGTGGKQLVFISV